MEIERIDLLKRCIAVSPGITPNDTIKQSSCIVLRKGRLLTMNREIACSILSNLDENIHAAIKAKPLMEMLKKMDDRVLEVTHKGNQLVLAGKQRTARITLEADVLLAISSVELPSSNWHELAAELGPAVDLAAKCTKKKAMHFAHLCVHFCPKYVEASDNNKMARWNVPTFVQKPVLIRGDSIRVITVLGMTKGQETRNWLHFKNPFGLRLSVKKREVEHYPDLSPFLSIKGEKVQFPRAIAEAADRAKIVLDDPEGGVKVSINRHGGLVQGQGMQGEFNEPINLDYKGRPLTFLIPAKLIADLVDQGTECEITESTLCVRRERYTFVTSLEVPKEGEK